jgi:hypothetical protein
MKSFRRSRMARSTLDHLGIEVAAAEAVVNVVDTEAELIVMAEVVIGEDVTEAIVIQMTGRSVVRMIVLMASEKTEIVVATRAVVDGVVMALARMVKIVTKRGVRNVRTRTGTRQKLHDL